jgi:hypothetical protein
VIRFQLISSQPTKARSEAAMMIVTVEDFMRKRLYDLLHICKSISTRKIGENRHGRVGMPVDIFYTLFVVSAGSAAFASYALSGIMHIKALRNLETR